MPTLQQIIAEKSNRLEAIPNKLINSVDKIQKGIFEELMGLIESLDTKDGKILLNKKNLVKIEGIVGKLSESVFGGEYIEAIESFAREKVFSDEFIEKALYDNILKGAQRNAVELLSEAGINTAFTVPLKNILTTSVSTGQSFGDTVKALRTFIEGNSEIDGTLLRHVKQVARDGFSFADRQYTNIIANDLGVEWYLYSGGRVTDTREFCRLRQGLYFHKKEVEKWANSPWQGKASGTTSSTIFTFAGGYNCMHSILPVSKFSVPKEVIQRNINNGNYKVS